VLLDFIPSHVSNQHPYFKDALGNLDSPYADWFLWKDEAHLTYAGYDDLESMPRLNFQNSEVVDYLIGIAQFWLALDANGQQDGGVDGFRVDNALFPPQSFWSDLRLALKDTWPETVLLGEVWVKTPVELSRYFDNQFDALFDFPFYHRLQGNQDRNDDGLLAGHGFPSLLTDSLEKAASLFPEAGMPVRFLSNHDTNRISNEVGSDQQRLSLAATLLSSLPGPIAIYYGEEIGMRGQKGGPPFWDNYRREPMEWYASENGPEQTRWFFPEDRWNEPNDGISVEEQDADPASLLNFYRHVLAIRRDSRALRTGSLTLLEIDSDQELVWGFDRHVQDGHILALFNFGSQPTQVRLESLPIETDLLDLVKGKRYPAPIPGMPYIMELAAGEAVLLTRAAGPTP
jgi:glycosidase